MSIRALFLPLVFLSVAACAQEPAPCTLVVPATVSANSEVVEQATCPCRVAAFEVIVYNRWATEVWHGSSLEGFPGALSSVKDLQAGTYLWKVKYTAIANGSPTPLEAMGYVNVLK